jgi:hypothetical protein
MPTPRPSPALDPERLLLALADHFHEHCTCYPGAQGAARCDACDLRLQLRAAREDLLTWRAEGRRLAIRRDEAIGNGTEHARHQHPSCDECRALAGLAETIEGS